MPTGDVTFENFIYSKLYQRLEVAREHVSFGRVNNLNESIEKCPNNNMAVCNSHRNIQLDNIGKQSLIIVFLLTNNRRRYCLPR
jgi:hypothetical protein